MVLCRKQEGACLLRRTADMFAVSHSRHVCYATQQTTPAVWHTRHCLWRKGRILEKAANEKVMYIYAFTWLSTEAIFKMNCFYHTVGDLFSYQMMYVLINYMIQ